MFISLSIPFHPRSGDGTTLFFKDSSLTPSCLGGLYEQFKLVRDPDQQPLEEIERSSPTEEQKRELGALQAR
jgi:hypothetical protein